MFETDEIIKRLKDLGFRESDNDDRVLAVEYGPDDGYSVATSLGFNDADDFEKLILQYDIDSETMVVCIDGDIDTVDVEEVLNALEGDE